MDLTFKNGFSFTSALISAKKRAVKGSMETIARESNSDYFSK